MKHKTRTNVRVVIRSGIHPQVQIWTHLSLDMEYPRRRWAPEPSSGFFEGDLVTGSVAGEVAGAVTDSDLGTGEAEQQVPCYFIFRDSVSDCGNNNPLLTFAKVNYPPYGIDFPGGVPTGCFDNGVASVDIIGPPDKGNPSANIAQGVNYASGGGGIRPDTSFFQGVVLNIQQQLENHIIIIAKIEKEGINNLSECLYTVNIGTNDYINNYYALGYSPGYFTSLKNTRQLSSLGILAGIV
ncbi:hypothetical protein Droror1_Dr00005544 [Drosera rotundifolia]